METIGGVEAFQMLQIEILGSERIELIGSGSIIKLFSYSETNQNINVAQEGFSFESESEEAPIIGYKLFDSNLQEYVGDQLSLS